MVKLILPNSAPPGQESQKCLENKCTALVTSRKKLELSSPRGRTSSPRDNRKTWVLVTSRKEKKTFLPARGDQSRSFSVHLFSKHFWLSLPVGAELNSSMKTTNFKPNLYFYHRIPLKGKAKRHSLNGKGLMTKA